MDDTQTLHAMGLDDAYRVERTLARGSYGVTELVTIDGAGPFVRKKIPLALARRDVWAALGECHNPRLPHVEATYELPDRFVVVCDFVPGDTLNDAVAAHRFDASRAVEVAIQLCDAVGELHAHGIVHRDITPKNVILSTDGAHLIDFGIARMRDDDASHDTTTLGTWGFASPEQYGFAQTDARSDVYSIGRLLGFMLTGAYPDEREYERLLADSLVVPPVLRAVIARACAFEPSARQSSASRLASELEASQDGRELPPDVDASAAPTGLGKRDLSGSGRSRLIVTVIASVLAVVLVVGVAVGVAWMRHGDRTDGATGASSARVTPKRNDKMSDVPQDDEGTGEDNGATPGADDVSGILTVAESGWSIGDSGFINYAYVVRNTSADYKVELAVMNITGRSADGAVLFTDSTYLSVIYPGQDLHVGGATSARGGLETLEFRVSDPPLSALSQAQGKVSFETTGLNVIRGEYGDMTFAGEVRLDEAGDVKALSEYSSVLVSIVLRDEKGRIVYGDFTYADLPSEGKLIPFSVPAMDVPAYKTYEAYAMLA